MKKSQSLRKSGHLPNYTAYYAVIKTTEVSIPS